LDWIPEFVSTARRGGKPVEHVEHQRFALEIVIGHITRRDVELLPDLGDAIEPAQRGADQA
jgi:hypothetical protein